MISSVDVYQVLSAFFVNYGQNYWSSPLGFNLVAPVVNAQLFNRYLKTYPLDERSVDCLSPFMKCVVLELDKGRIKLPDDFQRIDGLSILVSDSNSQQTIDFECSECDQGVEIKVAEEVFLLEDLIDNADDCYIPNGCMMEIPIIDKFKVNFYRGATSRSGFTDERNPKYDGAYKAERINEKSIQVYGNNVDSVFAKYIRKPKDPLLVYEEVFGSAFPKYLTDQVIDFEWSYQMLPELLVLFGEYFNISIRDQELINLAEGIKEPRI